MNEALVIGGGGFIGTHLVRYLCGRGWRVRIIDRIAPTEFGRLTSSIISWTEMDVHDDAELAQRIRKSSAVFHLAAQPSVEICEHRPLESARDNFLTTVKVLSELQRVSADHKWRQLVFTSTSAIYGDQQSRSPVSEDAPACPLSNYGKDKLRSEEAIFSAARQADARFGCSVLRLFNVYGLGQKRNSPYSGVITRFLDAFNAEEPLQIYGSGEQVRDFVHVSDVVRALYLAAQSPGFNAPLNVATGLGTTINGLADLFRNRKHAELNRRAPRTNDIFFSVGDCSKIRAALNWSASMMIEQGIEELVLETEKHPCGA